MTSSPKKVLKEIEKAPPGDRFERLYRKRQKSSHAKGTNVACNVGGLAVIALGVATYPIPVIPSEIVILAGLALVSQGSMRGARLLDGTELRLRRWFAPALTWWGHQPKWLRRTLAVVWMVAVSGLSYWAYRAIGD